MGILVADMNDEAVQKLKAPRKITQIKARIDVTYSTGMVMSFCPDTKEALVRVLEHLAEDMK